MQMCVEVMTLYLIIIIVFIMHLYIVSHFHFMHAYRLSVRLNWFDINRRLWLFNNRNEYPWSDQSN